MKSIIQFSTLVLFSTFIAQPVFSHSGRTDSSGCHTNRKTGQYHCHNKKIKPQAQKSRPRIRERKSLPLEKKSSAKNFDEILIDSGPKGTGPYKWEDENGLHFVFDINKVPQHLRNKIQKKSSD